MESLNLVARVRFDTREFEDNSYVVWMHRYEEGLLYMSLYFSMSKMLNAPNLSPFAVLKYMMNVDREAESGGCTCPRHQYCTKKPPLNLTLGMP